MFGKKILSVVSVLFLGSQIAIAAVPRNNPNDYMSKRVATDLDNCTTDEKGYIEDAGITPTTYCLDGTSIYGILNSNKKQMGDAVLIFESNGSLVEPSNVENSNDYSMYICNSDNVCARTYGYVKKNESTYLAIKKDNTGADSTSADTPGTTAGCTVGALFTEMSVKICIDDGKSVSFADGPGNYFMTNVGEGTGQTIFTATGADTKEKMVLDVRANTIVLNTVYNDAEYCSYENNGLINGKTHFCSGTILENLYNCVDGLCNLSHDADNVGDGTYLVHIGSNTHKVYTCTSHKCELQDDYTGQYVFQNHDATDITYEMALNDDALGSLNDITEKPIYLYDCFKGVCTPTSGFVKYNGGSSLASCNGSTCSSESSFVNCSGENAGDVGSVTSDMAVCTDVNTPTVVSGDGVFYGNKLYKKTGGNVVAASQQPGNYLFGSDIKICSNGSCTTPESFSGYILNSGSDKSTNPLIHCTTKINCSTIAKTALANGYYWNTDSTAEKVIICNNNGCATTASTVAKENCSSDQHKLIHNSGAFKYCDGTSSVVLTGLDGLKLYEVGSVKNSGINYPTDFGDSTSSKMVIKVTANSVTEYNNASDFCIHNDSNVLVEKGGCDSPMNIYTCTTAGGACSKVEPYSEPGCNPDSPTAICNGYYVTSENHLIKCTGVSCPRQNRIGYFKKDDATFIQCKTNGEETPTIRCEPASAPTKEGTSCIPGALVNDSGVKLCIDGSFERLVPIFVNDDSKNYLIKASLLNTKDGLSTNKYYVITIGAKEVETKTLSNADKKYIYTQNDGIPTPLYKGFPYINSDTCMASIVEFVKDGSDNTYNKSSST